MSNDRTAFQIGLDSISKIAHPKEHVGSIDGSLKDKTSFASELKEILSEALIYAQPLESDALQVLIGNVRFSDPISVPKSEEIERIILESAKRLAATIKDGGAFSDEDIANIDKSLTVRNDICKGAK